MQQTRDELPQVQLTNLSRVHFSSKLKVGITELSGPGFSIET